jgi:hypothetical protein
MSLLPPLVSVVIVLLLPILIMPSAIILNEMPSSLSSICLRLSPSRLSWTYGTHVHKFGPQVHPLHRAQSALLDSLRLTTVYLSARPSVRYRSIGVWLGIYAGAVSCIVKARATVSNPERMPPWTGQLRGGIDALGSPLEAPRSLLGFPCEVCITFPGRLLELCNASPRR